MQNPDVRVPAWFAIKRLGITKQTFNYWRTSGKVTADDNGEYRWGDVLAAEKATRTNPNSRRGIQLRPADGARSWPTLNINSAGMTPA